MPESQDTSQIPEGIIPASIVIGVTGHRKLDKEAALAEQVQRALERIRQITPSLSNTPLVFTVLSPVAEGADRLVAREVLKITGSQLEVVLPLSKDDYLQDFKSPASKTEFEEFLSRARQVEELPPTNTRNEAYEQVGHYVVDNCDVLIALWNGKGAVGQGGTAEIVEYARGGKCPLFWVHTDGEPHVTEERVECLSRLPLKGLDQYNSETVDAKKVKRQTEDHYRLLFSQTQHAHFPSKNLRVICEQLLPYYVRADQLALRYQHRYLITASLVYALAAAAVAVGAFQVIFMPNWPIIVVIEVLLMVALVSILWASSHQQWHTKWIDYRFLAERFRSALFLGIANVNVAVLRPRWRQCIQYSSTDWIAAAFTSAWSRQSRPCSPDHSKFEELRKFLIEAWVEDQIMFHRNSSKRHRGRYHRFERAGYILFGLTFAVAIPHILDVVPHPFHGVMGFLEIIFPAAGGALGAIRTHREYLRNAKRSEDMARNLEELKWQMIDARDLDSFLPLVKRAEEAMLSEVEDWRVVVSFQPSPNP